MVGTDVLEMSVPSDLKYLCVVRRALDAVCRLAGFDETTAGSVLLANDEACSNVVRHAYEGVSTGRIWITCRLSDDVLAIEVEDEGKPFDPGMAAHKDPAEVRPGGRGLFFIREIMDEVVYEPRHPRGTRLRMCKRRPREGAS